MGVLYPNHGMLHVAPVTGDRHLSRAPVTSDDPANVFPLKAAVSGANLTFGALEPRSNRMATTPSARLLGSIPTG